MHTSTHSRTKLVHYTTVAFWILSRALSTNSLDTAAKLSQTQIRYGILSLLQLIDTIGVISQARRASIIVPSVARASFLGALNDTFNASFQAFAAIIQTSLYYYVSLSDVGRVFDMNAMQPDIADRKNAWQGWWYCHGRQECELALHWMASLTGVFLNGLYQTILFGIIKQSAVEMGFLQLHVSALYCIKCVMVNMHFKMYELTSS